MDKYLDIGAMSEYPWEETQEKPRKNCQDSR
jgi:hypothetical protein